MLPRISLLLLSAAFPAASERCRESRGGLFTYCEEATLQKCECPWTTCVLDDGGVYTCASTPQTVVASIVFLAAVAIVVGVLAWCCCCKGPGCSVTPLCRGGCCFREAQGQHQQQPHPHHHQHHHHQGQPQAGYATPQLGNHHQLQQQYTYLYGQPVTGTPVSSPGSPCVHYPPATHTPDGAYLYPPPPPYSGAQDGRSSDQAQQA